MNEKSIERFLKKATKNLLIIFLMLYAIDYIHERTCTYRIYFINCQKHIEKLKSFDNNHSKSKGTHQEEYPTIQFNNRQKLTQNQ